MGVSFGQITEHTVVSFEFMKTPVECLKVMLYTIVISDDV